ncbi:MAG TPA: LptF/LptG family permease [Tepidisphaeraceae bacterium]|nr:LptF/LptG family permease [Tepidisphaeraceae bacterium]
MSKTLFWYLFRDLVRIFLLASGVLAGIMSFGGLLRPLTENGLNAEQVGKLLTYLTPAMMAYSLPAAALFATTVIYGRLAADNELTACRAAGISYGVIGLPAVVLGLGVAALSLLLLCFIVPSFSMRVEKVIYSNLANYVVNRIERTHQIRISTGSGHDYTVFADEAKVLPVDPLDPEDQRVQLYGPTVVTYEPAVKGSTLQVPKDFSTSQSATVLIHPQGADPVSDPLQITIYLVNGAKFPRRFAGDDQIGFGQAVFGPLALDNPLREDVKFMDIWKLVSLASDPGPSQRVSLAVSEIRRRDEEKTFLLELAADPQHLGVHEMHTAGTPSQTYSIVTDGPPPVLREDELIFTSAPGKRQVRLTAIDGEQTTLAAQAREARVRTRADDRAHVMVTTIELYDLSLSTPEMGLDSGAAAAERVSWMRTIYVPMDRAVLDLQRTETLRSLNHDPSLLPLDASFLRREQVVVNNAVRSELHGRASFAVSCLILVLVGASLGMMFKSGNFLNAFAVSFVPALLCITLVVAGQQTADHVPDIVDPHFLQHNSPLNLGLALIWSGNVIVAALAIALVAKLSRR